jgi:hypothetical protein
MSEEAKTSVVREARCKVTVGLLREGEAWLASLEP